MGNAETVPIRKRKGRKRDDPNKPDVVVDYNSTHVVDSTNETEAESSPEKGSGVLGDIAKALDPNRNGVAKALDPTQNGVADAFDPNKNGVAKAFDPYQNGVAEAFDPTKNGVAKALDPFQNGVADALDLTKNGVAKALDPYQNGIAGAFNIKQNKDGSSVAKHTSKLFEVEKSKQRQVINRNLLLLLLAVICVFNTTSKYLPRWSNMMTLIGLLLILLLFSHRLIAYSVCFLIRQVLRSLLCAWYEGAFDFDIGWISYRGFFDRNEIVISNIIFRNPPQYSKTPFLLHIKEISVAVDFGSIYGLSVRGDPLVMDHVIVNGLDLQIERVGSEFEVFDAASLNILAAFGIRTKQRENELIEFAIKYGVPWIKRSIAEQIAVENPNSPLLYFLVDTPTPTTHDASVSPTGAPTAILPKESDPLLLAQEMHSHHDSDSSPLHSEVDDHTIVIADAEAGISLLELPPVAKKPFRLDLARLLVMDLSVNIIDALAAEHVDTEAGSIRFKCLNITRDDLTGPPEVEGSLSIFYML